MTRRQPATLLGNRIERRRWSIAGQVQGVGFRPGVYRVATSCGLTGFVRNDAGSVTVEAQGTSEQLDGFDQVLWRRLPPLAQVRAIDRRSLTPLRCEGAFRIESSVVDGIAEAAVTVDTGVCDDCVRELLSSTDRRAGYALINCTNCGPRYTIVDRVPYDRCNTTMASFELCDECRRDYADPGDRRFHAQPIACHACGPKLQLVSRHGKPLPGIPLVEAARLLRAGRIVAIKGLGGFHLAVRADQESSVARLRELKHRAAKPFALMVASMRTARQLVSLSPAAEALLASPSRPIVLARRLPGPLVAASVAPGSHRCGVMLPYTPIHYLLFADLPDVEALVMTSGNQSDEPLVIDNAEAVARLSELCDAMLWHDRPIRRRVDDSVAIDFADSEPLFLRRSRGYAPQALPLPSQVLPSASVMSESRPRGLPTSSMTSGTPETVGLCVGGELKNTVALVRGHEVIMSQHVGDLKHATAYEQFKQTCDDLPRLFGVRPAWIASDLHPQYLSTHYARTLADQLRVPLFQVQHHHAHAAAAMADQLHPGPALALVCDGVGYGDDGGIWGGELLWTDYRTCRRINSLVPLPLIGGDAAARETGRCGLALLWQQPELRSSLVDHPLMQSWWSERADRQLLVQMLARNVNCIDSSAAGRWFDGVAALLGVCRYNHFESQAAQQLEALAASWAATGRDVDTALAVGAEPSFRWIADPLDHQLGRLDLTRLIRQLLAGREQGLAVEQLAFWFHLQFAAAWEAAIVQSVARTGVETIALSGGVFCNELLTWLLSQRLKSHGLHVLRHVVVSPNDSGLALGQAAVVMSRIADREASAATLERVCTCV